MVMTRRRGECLAACVCFAALAWVGCGAASSDGATPGADTQLGVALDTSSDAAASADGLQAGPDSTSDAAGAGKDATPADAIHDAQVDAAAGDATVADAAPDAQADAAADASCGVCDDNNPCTQEVCLQAKCSHVPLTDSATAAHPCDDGKPCTAADACQQGTCKGKPLRWQATFGGSDDDAAHDAAPLSDGGAFVVGHTRSKGNGGRDAWLLRVDRFGALVFDVTLGDGEDQAAYGAHRVGDVGLAVGAWRHAGDPRPRGFLHAALLEGGAPAGSHVFALQEATELHAVRAGSGQTGGMRTLAAGYVEDAKGDLRMVAARMDPISYAPLWVKPYGTTGFDVAWDVAVAAEGGFVVLGDTAPGGEGPHTWLVRLDDNGAVTWQRTYFQDGEDSGWGLAIHTDPALQITGIVVAGQRKPKGAAAAEGWLMRADATGNIVWQQSFPASGGATAFDVAVSQGGQVVVGRAVPKQGKAKATMWHGDGKGGLDWTASPPTPADVESEASAALVHNDGLGLAGRVGVGKAADALVVRLGLKGEPSCP